LTEFKIGEEFEHKIDYLTKEDVDFLEKEKICFKVYAFEDVEKKGKIGVDEILKIDKEVAQLNEPTDEIPKDVKIASNNYNEGEKAINVNQNSNSNNNTRNNNIRNNGPNNRSMNNNRFGYSNNQQNLNNINFRNQNEKMIKGKNDKDKDCLIF